jgi:hypothetical protein
MCHVDRDEQVSSWLSLLECGNDLLVVLEFVDWGIEWFYPTRITHVDVMSSLDGFAVYGAVEVRYVLVHHCRRNPGSSEPIVDGTPVSVSREPPELSHLPDTWFEYP